MTSVEQRSKPIVTVTWKGDGTSKERWNGLPTYETDAIVSLIFGFLTHISARFCSDDLITIEVNAKPANVGNRIGEFNEVEWRNQLLFTEDSKFELVPPFTDTRGAKGDVNVCYTFRVRN